jgi:hypothetical protein
MSIDPVLLSLLISNGLFIGAILSLLLVALMLGSLAVAPDLWVNDYPPDIRAKYGPKSARAKRFTPYFSLLFFAIVIGVLAFSLLRLRIVAEDPLNFLSAFLTAFLVLFTFNLVDLLVIDWLIFVTLQPSVIILPGTEDMAGYKDYRFHFVGFLKGILFSAGFALVIAPAAVGLQALLS